jgi:hypothetical protein
MAARATLIAKRVLIASLAAYLAVVLIDLPSAWNAQACWPYATDGCYPWGGAGPAADAGWDYSSKARYVASGVFSGVVLAGALFGALLMPKGYRIVALLAAIVLLTMHKPILQTILSL